MTSHRRVRRLLPIALALLVILLAQFVLVGSVAAQEVDIDVDKWAYWGGGGLVSGMTLDGPYAVAGEELFYSISYHNYGTSTAISVTLTDTLPAEVQYLEDTGGGVLGAGNTLVWDVGDLAGGESGYIDIKTRVWADAVAGESDGTILITNTIEASSTEDVYMDNNYDYAATFVQDLADLSVVKMSKPDTVVQAGELFTYTIFVENWGPSSARDVSIRDEILASEYFTVVETILDPLRDDSGPYFTPSPEGGLTMEFDLHEPLEPIGIENGGRWVIQIVVMSYETQDINNLVHVFTYYGGTPDPDISNNTAIDFISVLDTSDLELTKDAYDEWLEPPDGMGDLATAGLGIIYELFVTNNGPSTAENVVIEDNLPAEVDIISVSSSQGSCIAGTPGDPNDPTTCNVGTLAPGATAVM